MTEAVGVTVTATQLGTLVRELKKADTEFAKAFRKEVHVIGKPLTLAAAKEVRAGTGWSMKGTAIGAHRGSLRDAVARSIKTKTQFGKRSAEFASVDVVASARTFASQMSRGRGQPLHSNTSLLLMIEGKKKWRHPVMGNRSVWVEQASQTGMMKAATEKAAPAFVTSLGEVVKKWEEGLARAVRSSK